MFFKSNTYIVKAENLLKSCQLFVDIGHYVYMQKVLKFQTEKEIAVKQAIAATTEKLQTEFKQVRQFLFF